MGFIDYMINKGDGHYLHEQPEWLKEIVKNSSVERKKGLHASPPIKAHCRGLLKSYLDEVYHQEKDPKTGSVLKEVTGVTKVFDPMLLEEVIHFNAKTGNYDRIVAASLAVALARHLDPVYSKISNVEEDPRLISYWKGKESGSTILHERYSSSLFRKRNKSRLFL
jgi:hypothetical protein